MTSTLTLRMIEHGLPDPATLQSAWHVECHSPTARACGDFVRDVWDTPCPRSSSAVSGTLDPPLHQPEQRQLLEGRWPASMFLDGGDSDLAQGCTCTWHKKFY